jgi:hypothetical protein
MNCLQNNNSLLDTFKLQNVRSKIKKFHYKMKLID